ncbi:hypothetical protein KC19_9G022800 [Ceratodon purpureus]|uniref:Secreted protein n=1 Tax=Ceratodon purpureus TaxID=3225 RepID=A0A8T0GRV1_CERPU|nr:hypothetical protein KC19_9G022800 [Ceratodon purpureus]
MILTLRIWKWVSGFFLRSALLRSALTSKLVKASNFRVMVTGGTLRSSKEFMVPLSIKWHEISHSTSW